LKKPLWSIVAAGLWGVVLVALLLRAGLHPARPTSLTTYLAGGRAWSASRPVYTNWRGFVYPPVIAWFFSLPALLPIRLAAVLWRVLTACGFLAGLGAVLRSDVFHRIPAHRRGLVFLGVLPLAIGNLDNAQANPLIAGLMMLAVAAMQWEMWTLCAAAVALATMFKIYPVALALLLCLLRPRQLAWRSVLILGVLALLPYAAQQSHYVSGEYHAWLAGRLNDDRLHYPMKDAPLDIWFLLVRLGRLPIPPAAYMALQVAAGAAIAAMVWVRARAGAMLRDNLALLFLLGSAWMLLLGPATENQTFVVLAPAATLLAVECLAVAGAARVLAIAAYALLLAAVARNSLMPSLKGPLWMAIQPVGALVYLAAILLRPR
jgi:hypothetical protein